MKFRTVLLGGAVAGGVMVGYNKYVDGKRRLPSGSHVVIVGGGYGGLTLADKMHGKGNYTLIDIRDCMHHNLGSLRAVAEPGFSIKTFLPYFPKYSSSFKQGKVVAVDTDKKVVKLEGEDSEIPYTHLVFATGSSGPFPGKAELSATSSDLIKKYEDYAQAVVKAKKIIIIGGGAVGVELAAEIGKEYPGKSVTIIHNGPTLVSRSLADKALKRVESGLAALNVNIIRGDTVKNMEDLPMNVLVDETVVETTNGLKLDANLVIPCVGLAVNTDAYSDSIPEKMNKKGQLMVDEYLQVEGLDNVFAIGDCNDLPVTKLALQAQFQAGHLWENLSSASSPKPYKNDMFVMAIPLGRDGGILQAGKFVMPGDWGAKKVKAKDVLVPKVWPLVGQPVPENSVKS